MWLIARATNIPLSAITQRISVRSIKPAGVELLKAKIQKLGYLPGSPLLVTSTGNGSYELLDGNHRLDALLALGHTEAPVEIITDALDDIAKKQLARSKNEGAEAVIPTTFCDDAEFVWREGATGKTQEEIGIILRWSRDKIAKYAALDRVNRNAWTIVTKNCENVTTVFEDTVTQNVPTVTFTETLLRSILDLTPSQQVELVSALAEGRIQKGTFKAQAEAYKARNEMCDYARRTITPCRNDRRSSRRHHMRPPDQQDCRETWLAGAADVGYCTRRQGRCERFKAHQWGV